MWKSLALFAGLASAASISARQDKVKEYPDYSLLKDCPGYKVVDVKESDTGVKADLELAGDKCDVYGDDLESLTLEVTYETGESTLGLHRDCGRTYILTKIC